MWLNIAEIIVSVVLIVLILVQERSSGAGGLFGGGAAGSTYQTRRGLENVIYWATLVSAAIFAGLAIINLLEK